MYRDIGETYGLEGYSFTDSDGEVIKINTSDTSVHALYMINFYDSQDSVYIRKIDIPKFIKMLQMAYDN